MKTADMRPVADLMLQIDWTRCDGHGYCAALLPRSVAMDDWGYPIIDRVAVRSEKSADLKRAVSTCPAMALRLKQ